MRGALTAVSMAAMVLFGTASASAQNDYVVGVDDVLNVSVWQREDLSRTVAVRATGKVTFPPVGEIQAAGRSTSQLAQSIEDELYAYTRQRPEVTVSVIAFNSRKVFVTGQVAQPGRYAFEQIPPIPEVLGIAGGALPGAQLSEVRIVRNTNGVAQSIPVDLQGYLQGSQTGTLPELLPGDLLYVPGSFGTAQGAGAVAGDGSVAYVVGQVARPGAYAVSGQADLLEVLALAGGTSPLADLEHVQVLTNESGSMVVAEIDVEEYFRRGAETGGFPVMPGDTINVPSKGPGTLGKAWGYTGQFLSLSRDVLNAVIIGDYLRDQ